MTELTGKQWLPQPLQAVTARILAERKLIGICFLSVFFWGLLAHAYGFLHSSLSHDALNAFIATQIEETLKVETGRYIVPLYRWAFRGAVTLPWLTGILGLVWTAAALFLTTNTFQMRSPVLIFLVSGIMTTNITYISQIATYLHEFDANACALLLAISAVYLWNRHSNSPLWIAGGICLAFSVGIYQAYFAIAATLIVFRCILDLLAGKQMRDVVSHGLRGILMLLLALIVYLLVGKLVYMVTGVTQQSRTDALFMAGNNPILHYIGLIPAAFRYLAGSIFHKAHRTAFFTVCTVLVIVLLALSVIRLAVVKKFRSDTVLLLIVLLLLLPFALSCVYLLANGLAMHDLTKYAIWFCFIFALLLAFRLCEADTLPTAKNHFLRLGICLWIFSILWQNVTLSNTAYMKKEMEAKATLSTMTRVVSVMDSRQDYVPGETPVAFIGAPSREENIPGMEAVSHITGLASDFAIPGDGSLYYYNAYKAYFTYVLQTPVVFCEDDVHEKLKTDPRVEAMPLFPSAGSMELVDGVLVIKMGE